MGHLISSILPSTWAICSEDYPKNQETSIYILALILHPYTQNQFPLGDMETKLLAGHPGPDSSDIPLSIRSTVGPRITIADGRDVTSSSPFSVLHTPPPNQRCPQDCVDTTLLFVKLNSSEIELGDLTSSAGSGAPQQCLVFSCNIFFNPK